VEEHEISRQAKTTRAKINSDRYRNDEIHQRPVLKIHSQVKTHLPK